MYAAGSRSRFSRSSALLVAFVLSVGAVAAEKPTLDRCAGLVRDRPEELDSYMCYWFVARGGDSDGASRALESILAIDPSNHRARLYLGSVEADLGHARAEALYREAADGFAEWREATGEVYARLSLCHVLRRAGRSDEADEELRRSDEVAKASGDPVLEARVWTFQASAATQRGVHGEAIRLLRQAEQVAFPDGPVDLRSGVLSRMAYAYWAQGLIEQALETYTRQAELMAAAGDPFVEAAARINAAILSVQLFDGGRTTREDVIDRLADAAEMASRVGNRSAEARARMQRGRYDRSERGLAEIERAVEIYGEIGSHRGAREAIRQLSYALWELKPERRTEAYRLLEGAIEDARSTGDLEELARGLIGKGAIAHAEGDREVWIETYLDALETVEKIRDLQPDGTVGARLFSRWAFAYSRLSGGLLEGLPSSPDPMGDLDLAFRTIERMRSRVLIETLDRAGANPASATGRMLCAVRSCSNRLRRFSSVWPTPGWSTSGAPRISKNWGGSRWKKSSCGMRSPGRILLSPRCGRRGSRRSPSFRSDSPLIRRSFRSSSRRAEHRVRVRSTSAVLGSRRSPPTR